MAACQAGDYDKVYKAFRTLAEQGNPDTQNNLGVMYNQGGGIPQDHAEATK